MTLYDPALEKDNCGFGLIAISKGKPATNLSVQLYPHWIV